MEGKRISQLTPDTSPSTDDYIVTVDGTATQNKRVELGSLPVSNPTRGYVDNRTPIYGTGFPNGVVIATPGRIYIDENNTNGASSWIKKSGTGNTGWQVLEGDTGWRDVTGLLINGWTATRVALRRTASRAEIALRNLNSSTATATYALYMPLGFRVAESAVGSRVGYLGVSGGALDKPMYQITFGTDSAIYVNAPRGTGGLILNGNESLSVGAYGANTWPSSLPGTPV